LNIYHEYRGPSRYPPSPPVATPNAATTKKHPLAATHFVIRDRALISFLAYVIKKIGALSLITEATAEVLLQLVDKALSLAWPARPG
jgi:hypothetical protein